MTSLAISGIVSNSLSAAREARVRESMRMRTTQNIRTLPVVLISLIALEFAFQDRVNFLYFNVWACFLAAASIARALLCSHIARQIPVASVSQMERYEPYLYVSAILNGIAIGSAFWLVAAFGDLTVRMVMTLISCFYAVGALVNASSHFQSFAVVTAINLGQGALFWFGVGGYSPMQLEIVFPYLAVTLLIISFGYENSKQFAQSIEIRTQNDALLAQLGTEKKVVERALEEARLASESKSRFLAAASHDLRQPLHALTMFLGTLSFHVTTADAQRLLARVKETTDILAEQFNSLLDLSKFDVGAVTPEIATFDLRLLTEKLVEEFHFEAASKNLSIVAMAAHDAIAKSDPILIERLLRNLIGNAVKYTVSGSVFVVIDAHDSEYLVEVVDTGAGIPEDQQARIFEEYVQLSNPGRQRRYGVGLGLAIARRIDLLLGLRLTLKSTLDQGSRFVFTVPRAAQGETVVQKSRPTVDVMTFRTGAHIWILDDDPSVQEGLRGQLSAWGAKVEVFSEPAALLDKLRSGTALPRWILTDDMLGSALSGLETAQILSSEFGFGRVCLVTGNTEPNRLSQLRESGFPVIIKGAKPETLIEIIRD